MQITSEITSDAAGTAVSAAAIPKATGIAQTGRPAIGLDVVAKHFARHSA